MTPKLAIPNMVSPPEPPLRTCRMIGSARIAASANAILSKKTRPGVAVFVGYLPEAFLTYLTLAVLKIPYGLPLPVIYTILLKAFAEFIILAILMEIIMRNKGIKHFLESKVGFLYL